MAWDQVGVGVVEWVWPVWAVPPRPFERMKEGTFIIDMYRAEDKQLVWRGTVTGTISDNPRNNEKNIVKGIAKMFEKFPPPPEKS